MSWAKPRIYYNTGIAALTVTPAAPANYPVSNLIDGFDGTLWKAPDTTTQIIKHDAGASLTHTYDFLSIVDHNFAEAKPDLTLEYSSDDVTYYNSLTLAAASALYANPMILQEFTQRVYRYQKLTLANCLVAPVMSMCYWGAKKELDYVDVSFDPNAIEEKANVNVTETGYLSGVHMKYIERTMDLQWEDAEDALYQILAGLVNTMDLRNFVVAWEPTSHSTEIYLMRRDGKFSNPLTQGGARRSIMLALKGRKL
jgi:hypothetical protein